MHRSASVALTALALLDPVVAASAPPDDVFATVWQSEESVLSPLAALRLAQASVTAPIRIIRIRGGIGTPSLPPAPQVPLRTVVGTAQDRTGRQVHFKVVRGPDNPPDEVAAGGAPYEMYMCFKDSYGRRLFSLSMGHEMSANIPECDSHGPSADTADTEADETPSIIESFEATKAVVKAMRILKRYPFTPAFENEHRTLVEQQRFLKKAHRGRRLVASDAVIIMDANGQAVPNGTRLEDLNTAQRSSSDLARPQVTWYRGRRHAVEAHAGPIHGLSGIADHSATYTALYEEWPAPLGSYHNIHANCNHGRCPNTMRFKYLILTEPRRHTHVHNWFCQTAYNALSFTGTHNCNDDTVCSTRSVRFDVHWNPIIGTPCNDPYLRRYAPGPWD